MKAKGRIGGEEDRKIGMHSRPTPRRSISLTCVPQRYRIGQEGMGFTYQMMQFQEERLWGASAQLLSLQECIEETIAYTRERKLFGSTVLEQQWVHYKLAECQTELEAFRALVYRAVDLYLKGEDVTMLASMAKLKAGRLGRTIPDTCLQFWGGMGYSRENRVSKLIARLDRRRRGRSAWHHPQVHEHPVARG